MTLWNYRAHVTHVVDGDTLDCCIDLGFHLYFDTRIRLTGLNAPDIHSTDPVVRTRAVLAKAYVESACLDKNVIIETEKTEKFGRWLATVASGGVDVNKELLAQGLADPYDGHGPRDLPLKGEQDAD